MASITSFSPESPLQNRVKRGLRNNDGSVSQIILLGDGLDGLNLYVKKKNGDFPKWEGPLIAIPNLPGRWRANLICKTSASDIEVDAQLGEGVGDPADVPVTVTAGTTPTAPAATADSAVQIGTTP